MRDVFFFKQKTAYEVWYGLVGSEMCIRDSDGIDAIGVGSRRVQTVADAAADQGEVESHHPVPQNLHPGHVAADAPGHADALAGGYLAGRGGEEVDHRLVAADGRDGRGLRRQDGCLLYTSDAADQRSSGDLGGRRFIKKKKKETYWRERVEIGQKTNRKEETNRL